MDNLKIYSNKISEKIFSELLTDEDLSLFIHSEESQFVRFSQSQVRQNTFVQQHELFVRYQTNQRLIKFTVNLTLDFILDIDNILAEIKICRQQIQHIDVYPQFVNMANNGISETINYVKRPNDFEMIQFITDYFKNTDMAGLYCSGPVRQISINSKGQFHYFENDFFFLDYSIYNGSKAAKGFFSTDEWALESLIKNIQKTKDKLELLNLPLITVPKGQYQVYLEPMAVQELLWGMAWNGFSQSSLSQGRSSLKKLNDQEVCLSEIFNLNENLSLGYVPLFNSIGEIAPENLELVENGLLKNLLTSSATAQEYKLNSNYADPAERFRSPEIKPGQLLENEILNKLGTGLYLSNLHYINWSDQQSARLTGMTRFACFWVENGKIQGPIQDLRFDDSIYNLFGSNLVDLTSHQELFVESMTYQKRYLGATKVPGALIKNFNFTL